MNAIQCLNEIIRVGVVGILSSVSAAQAAELSGSTRDAVSDTAVASVKVKLLTIERKPYKNAITDDAGKYRIQDIGAGDYLVVFEKTGFIANPKGTNINLKLLEVKQQDATLYPEEPDEAYLNAFAGKIKANARGPEWSSTERGYAREWGNIEQLALPREFKARLAKELEQQDTEALNVPAIRDRVNEFNHRNELETPEIILRPNKKTGPIIDRSPPLGVDPTRIRKDVFPSIENSPNR